MTSRSRRAAAPSAATARLGRAAAAVSVVALLGALLAPWASPSASADPLGDADREVRSARAALDAASSRYFEALGEYRALDDRIGRLEAGIAAGEDRIASLRRVVASRAVEAYKSGSQNVGFVFDSRDVTDLTVRRKLLSVATASDAGALDELERSLVEQREQRDALASGRARRERSLEEMRRAQESLDARLAAALEGRAGVRRRLAEQARAAAALAASRTAAARTAATVPAGAPATPPAPLVMPAPGGGGDGSIHDHPFLACVRHRESRGDYGVVNPAGPWYGAYQFSQSTWNATAAHAGRYDLVGVVPSTASPSDQDAMAWALYQWQGSRPWGGSC